MADLDKKIQKTQVDLVQAVMEAYDRKNLERVDTLITTALKQLKMSRFKPDLTTCISLAYIVKLNPKIFARSQPIKEIFKALLRKETGPTNIKGKNDTVLPLLAANIMLVCSDNFDTRKMILQKVDHWISTNQKVTDQIQFLLATICTKCKEDSYAIETLVEMREHWIRYIVDNFDTFELVPSDLCMGIRNLLDAETESEDLLSILQFLIKYDTDIEGLSNDVGKFVIEKPLTLDSMRRDQNQFRNINKLILEIFLKLLIHLKSTEGKYSEVLKTEIKQEIQTDGSAPVIIKQEQIKQEQNSPKEENNSPDIPKLYMNLPDSKNTIVISKSTAEAILTVLSTIEPDEIYKQEYEELMNSLLIDDKNPTIVSMYEDFSLNIPYDISDKLRHKLIRSQMSYMVELATRNADVGHLVELVQQFGSSPATLNKIIKKLVLVNDNNLIISAVNDLQFFNELVEYYSSIGVSGAKELTKRLKT